MTKVSLAKRKQYPPLPPEKCPRVVWGRASAQVKRKTVCAQDLLRAQCASHHCTACRFKGCMTTQPASMLCLLIVIFTSRVYFFHIGPNEIAAYMKHLHSSEFRIMHLGSSTSQWSCWPTTASEVHCDNKCRAGRSPVHSNWFWPLLVLVSTTFGTVRSSGWLLQIVL